MEIITSSFLIGMAMGCLAIAILLLWFSTFKVEEGHGAVITRFGAVLTRGNTNTSSKDLLIFKPGIHWKQPWDKVHRFSTMERILDLSGDEGGQHTLTADATLIRVDSKIRFNPLDFNLYSYLFELKNPMAHLKQMFTCLLRNEIANFSSDHSAKLDFVGSYSEIRRDKKLLNQQMDSFCRSYVGSKYGVEFRGVDLIDILPPMELETALNSIQNAQAESDTIFARAEADARQKIAAAEQGLEIATIKAKATAIEIKTLGEVIESLLADGQWKNYLRHRKTEILGDSRLTFVQKKELL